MSKTLTTTDKAAILVANLDRHTADMLLDQMTREQASAVRRAVIELDQLDPQLIEEVLEEFRQLNGFGQRSSSGNEVTWEPSGDSSAEALDDVPWNGTLATHGYARQRASWRPPLKDRFACLRGSNPATVARYFAHEHPQTIAVVFSHLAPEQSADILAQLPPPLQADVLCRLADLEETDPEILRDIESSVERWLREQDQHGQRRRTGVQAIRRILASAELGAKEEILANLGRHDRDFARQFGYAENLPQLQLPKEFAIGPRVAAFAADIVPEQTIASAVPPHMPAGRSLQFGDLVHLDDEGLAEIFSRTEPEVIRIALAGAPATMVQRLLSRLPVDEQQSLHKALSHVGPLRMSDIELSQQHLAQLATAWVQDGKLPAACRTARRAGLGSESR